MIPKRNRTARLIRLESIIVMLCLGFAAQAMKAQEKPSSPDANPTNPTVITTAAPETEDVEILRGEVGDRDITYLRSRVAFRYDYKTQDGPTEKNRFRLKTLYAFGPHERFGVSVQMPVIWKSTREDLAFGSGIWKSRREWFFSAPKGFEPVLRGS